MAGLVVPVISEFVGLGNLNVGLGISPVGDLSVLGGLKGYFVKVGDVWYPSDPEDGDFDNIFDAPVVHGGKHWLANVGPSAGWALASRAAGSAVVVRALGLADDPVTDARAYADSAAVTVEAPQTGVGGTLRQVVANIVAAGVITPGVVALDLFGRPVSVARLKGISSAFPVVEVGVASAPSAVPFSTLTWNMEVRVPVRVWSANNDLDEGADEALGMAEKVMSLVAGYGAGDLGLSRFGVSGGLAFEATGGVEQSPDGQLVGVGFVVRVGVCRRLGEGLW